MSSWGHFLGLDLIAASVLTNKKPKYLLHEFSLFHLLWHLRALSCHLGGTFGASFSGHKNVMYIIICCMQGMWCMYLLRLKAKLWFWVLTFDFCFCLSHSFLKEWTRRVFQTVKIIYIVTLKTENLKFYYCSFYDKGACLSRIIFHFNAMLLMLFI